jgi:hypothetical protein
MPRPGSCGELRERLERARLLLYLIELDIGDAEQALSEDPRNFIREYYEWLRRMRSEVEDEVRELEQALGRCRERFRDLLMEILRDLRWEITTCEFHPGTVPTPTYGTTPSPGEDLLGSLKVTSLKDDRGVSLKVSPRPTTSLMPSTSTLPLTRYIRGSAT